MNKLITLFLFFISALTGLRGQEKLYDLEFNSLQHGAWLQGFPHNAHSRAGDTLPFIDDFSNNSTFPNQLKWEGFSIYQNAHFPVNPPTYGVATMDGLSFKGTPYFTGSGSSHGSADTLTSISL